MNNHIQKSLAGKKDAILWIWVMLSLSAGFYAIARPFYLLLYNS